MFIIKQSLVAYSLITFEILCGQNQKKINAMRYPIYFHIRKAKFMYLPFQRCVEFLKPSRIFINNFKVKNTTLFAFNDDRKWRANYWYLLFLYSAHLRVKFYHMTKFDCSITYHCWDLAGTKSSQKHLNDISKISQQKKYLCIHISKKVKLKTTENQCMVLKVSWVFWVTKGINLPFLLQYPVNDQAKGHQPQLLLNLLSYGHLLTLLLCPAQLLQ